MDTENKIIENEIIKWVYLYGAEGLLFYKADKDFKGDNFIEAPYLSNWNFLFKQIRKEKLKKLNGYR